MAQITPPVAVATIRLDANASRVRARLITQLDIRDGIPSHGPMYFFSTNELLQAVREFVDSYAEIAGSADELGGDAPEPSE